MARPDTTDSTLDVWWWRTDRLDDARLQACEAMLDDEERAQAARFVFWRDRRDYVAAHALLRMSLSSRADGGAHGVTPARVSGPSDWRFGRTEHGKPFLLVEQGGCAPAFNLSHTRGGGRLRGR